MYQLHLRRERVGHRRPGGAPPLLAFLTARGYDPVTPDPDSHAAVSRVLNDYEERVRSTDPLRVRFTFSVDGDELELTVEGDLDIVEAIERSGATDG